MHALAQVAGSDPGRGSAQRSPARAAPTLAFLTVAIWYVVVSVCLPHTLGDEMYHVPAIRELAAGRPLGRELPMLPTYHWLLAQPVRLISAELWFIRLLQCLLGLTTILVYRAAVRLRYPDDNGYRLLLLTWNPLVFPFFVLVYTDTAALLLLLTSVWLHLRRRPTGAAAAALAACLVRQSNVFWLAFIIGWRLSEVLPRTAGRSWAARLTTAILAEGLWLHALAAAALLFLLWWRGGPVMAPFLENRPHFNPAQFYLFGLTCAICWLPSWVGELVGNWRRQFGPVLLRPSICAVLAAAVGLLTVAFRNPHPWNQELEFLHNWPLRLMAGWPALRLMAAVLLVTFVISQARITWRQHHRTLLLMLWVTAIVFLLPHYPAETRYYIVPLVLIDLFTPHSPGTVSRQSLWYLLLTVGAATFIAARPGPYGGL